MYRTILVPLDSSAFGEHALPVAATLARRADATLHLAHVHQVVPPATVAGIAVMDSLELHLRQDEQAYLADAKRRLSAKAPIEVQPVLLEGDLSTAFQAYADRTESDLVVMCSHGRGALGRFWLGSVADDLVRHLTRPVLLVRPHEGQSDPNRESNFSAILLPLDGKGRQDLRHRATGGAHGPQRAFGADRGDGAGRRRPARQGPARARQPAHQPLRPPGLPQSVARLPEAHQGGARTPVAVARPRHAPPIPGHGDMRGINWEEYR